MGVRITFVLSAVVLLGKCAVAAETNYQLRFETQAGYHLSSIKDMAVNRNILRAEAGAKLSEDSPWSIVAGLRAYAEGAFGSNQSHFHEPVIQNESQEIVPRNLYLQYEDGPFLIRAGNQQAVWGEAFGFYYADIVNPKDLRQGGFGDLEDYRVPTPMLNAKWIVSNYSIQGLFIPKPYFNKLPSQGGDFAVPFSQFFPSGTNLTVNDTQTAPLAFDNSEWGLRGTALVSGVDTSLFFLSYLDRMPNYSVKINSLNPLTLEANAFHQRIYTLGATATADLSSVVLRWESFFTFNRLFDSLSSSQLSNVPSDEFVGVLGVDYTQLGKWVVGAQVSEDYLTHSVQHLLNNRTGPQLSLHLHGPVWREQSIEMIFSVYPTDGSTLTEIFYDAPVSGQLIVGLGGIWLQGAPSSRLGSISRASRVFVYLKGFFNG